ncbi:hypothetical protein ACIQ7S_14975 [Streptomyces griseoluteus]|uniref:hypothetical protein n=1 Tax=Streptomyces griseoluteus TaxID=29306 RepID=UPI0033233792
MLAAVCAVAGLALAAVAVWVDLDTADKIASVAGACVGFLGCALSIYFEVRRGGSGGHVVRADGRGAVAAGGSAVGNATGKNARATRSAASAPTGQPVVGGHQVSAAGPSSLAAAGDAVGNATGDDSEAEER